MHAVGFGRQRHVQPIVHHYARTPLLVRMFDGTFREGKQAAGRQVFFTNLHPIHTRADGLRNATIKSGGFNLRAVGNVVELEAGRHFIFDFGLKGLQPRSY
jgi:hypothetical protein